MLDTEIVYFYKHKQFHANWPKFLDMFNLLMELQCYSGRVWRNNSSICPWERKDLLEEATTLWWKKGIKIDCVSINFLPIIPSLQGWARLQLDAKQGSQMRRGRLRVDSSYRLEFRLQPLHSSEEGARICSADIPMEEGGFYCAENRSFLRWRWGSCLTLCQLLTMASPAPCSGTGCEFRSRNYSKAAGGSGDISTLLVRIL